MMNNEDNNNNDNINQKSNKLVKKLAIAWIDLKFSGRSLLCRKPKTILNVISGSINFGTLNALMGPSGSGKSTLLKCINGMNSDGLDDETSIYLSAERDIRSCFIVQDVSEHLLMGLTAIQSLVYASKLKNSNEIEKIDHKLNAEKLLVDLMISDIKKTLVSRCSGGEQKRLAIALELMALKKPNILCIDEPTSGLDSNAAEIVIRCLKDLSRKHNMAIVTSIHQPNNDVLMLFDRLYVLAKGGLCVYEGPPQDLMEHLRSSQFECNEYQVPIEVLLKIASKYDASLHRLAKTNNLKKNLQLQQKCLVEGYLAPKGILHKSCKFQFKQMLYLLLRTMTYTYRSQWTAMVIQFMCFMALALIATNIFNKHVGEPDGCFSFDVTSNTTCVTTVEVLREEALVLQNLSLQFFISIELMFLTVVATTTMFAAEVKIFFNEHKNGWYSTGAYYWAKTIVELPLTLLIIVCYALIAYKSNNQIDESNRFIGYLLTLGAGVLCSQGLGQTVGIAAHFNDKLAISLSVGLYLIHVMLCGFLAPIEELPKEVRWAPQLAYVKQVFENQMTLIYGFDRCPNGQLSSILYRLKLLDKNKFWINCGILCFQIINYRVLALLILLLKANPISLTFPKRAVNSNEKIKVKPI